MFIIYEQRKINLKHETGIIGQRLQNIETFLTFLLIKLCNSYFFIFNHIKYRFYTEDNSKNNMYIKNSKLITIFPSILFVKETFFPYFFSLPVARYAKVCHYCRRTLKHYCAHKIQLKYENYFLLNLFSLEKCFIWISAR